MTVYFLFPMALWLLTLSGVADDTTPSSDNDAQATAKFVERKLKEALEILRKEELDEEVKKQQVRELALGMFNVPYMAKQVIGRRHWPKFSNPQRQEFTDLFTRQLEASYFDKMALFREASFEFEEPIDRTVTGKRKKYFVTSRVNYRDQRYEILYKLIQFKAVWRAYDVAVDGISVVVSYREQYGQVLQDASPEELLKKMRQKNISLPPELEEKQNEFQETHGINIVASNSEAKEKKN